jgi:hypothetical protein
VMATDRDLVNKVVDAIEDLFLESKILRRTLESQGVTNIQEIIAKEKSDPAMRESVKKILAPLREELQDPTDLAAVIEELTRRFPPGRPN